MLRPIHFMLVASFLTIGCATAMYEKTAQSWDVWIGTSKDDRVKDLGVPTRCHTFKSGGEACEWPIRWPVDSTGMMSTVTVQFDAKGNACSWTYRDSFGDRRSQSQCQ